MSVDRDEPGEVDAAHEAVLSFPTRPIRQPCRSLAQQWKQQNVPHKNSITNSETFLFTRSDVATLYLLSTANFYANALSLLLLNLSFAVLWSRRFQRIPSTSNPDPLSTCPVQKTSSPQTYTTMTPSPRNTPHPHEFKQSKHP